jgi:DNA-binding transcriptional ArsR family regulator
MPEQPATKQPATEHPSYIELTAESVKVLAHPLRSRLLSELRRGGPASATALAATLHTNTGATSYHLRKLEAVGLVTDTGEGRGKERLWRPTTESHGWRPSAYADDEDARTAIGWLLRDYNRMFAERYAAWLDVAESWPAPWQDTLESSDTVVEVTPEQMRALHTELEEVLARYRHAGSGDPRARAVSVYRVAMPHDLSSEPPPEDEP